MRSPSIVDTAALALWAGPEVGVHQKRGRWIQRGEQGEDANRDKITFLVVSGTYEVDFGLLELE